MRDLNHDFKLLCQRNRDGSMATQHDREVILSLVADQLHEGGFHHLRAQGMRTKHIDYLVERWHETGIAAGTFKNRMSALRWLAEKIGKQNIVRRDNAAYGIPERQHVSNTSKARTLDGEQLSRITDPYTAMSLRLEEAFGLRREESIKIQPSWADRGLVLRLKASWTKGGRERVVAIFNPKQRQVLAEAKTLAQGGSLIPPHMNYREQLYRFKAQTARAGIGSVHGLRHAYAQTRYLELTGWKAPAAGGPRSRDLTRHQKTLDQDTRLIISRELGHGREQITAVYLGR
ncbi:phage integrase N-terminal domain-containing protein [Pseudorhodoferax sp.]|uniref:phage integrase N-terminal domain-containing protein n=1 Tax=Pseudorhodoferax sp. TaxID=1993553 RepID=UPI002DD66801|nr:phage integrase N-terminal domain-containing protein [Pseudorhodoferax sp.]